MYCARASPTRIFAAWEYKVPAPRTCRTEDSRDESTGMCFRPRRRFTFRNCGCLRLRRLTGVCTNRDRPTGTFLRDRSRKTRSSEFEQRHRYSISIHGNNHDHTEFFRDTDDGRSTPLTDEELAARLKQAVARMEQFRMRTSISYDRFMIFPHERFPSATLRFMKRFNY